MKLRDFPLALKLAEPSVRVLAVAFDKTANIRSEIQMEVSTEC